MEYYDTMEDVLFFIEDHLQENFSLDSVANHFNISKFYFHRLFSAVMGVSLNNYFVTRRINASIDLIQNTNNSLTDIAYQLNFSSQAAFTRAFKRQYGFSPNHLRSQNKLLEVASIPQVVKRPIKNINGDVISGFTLSEFQPLRIKGIVFEVDLAADDFKLKIKSYANLLVESLNIPVECPCYIVYSNCRENSTKFNVIFGLPLDFDTNIPNVFETEVPCMLCARLKYSGDLLEIGDLFKTDAAKFLKISKLETEDNHIELIQVFKSFKDLYTDYEIYLPIKRLKIDDEM